MKDIIIWSIVILALPIGAAIGRAKDDYSLSDEQVELRVLWQLQTIRLIASMISSLLLAILVVLAIQFTID